MNVVTRPQRRTQAERSEAMRARIAAAAFATAAAGGPSALRMRSVAEAAGISQGALLHHFPDKNALVLAAIGQALSTEEDEGALAGVSTSTDPAVVLGEMLAEFRQFFFSDRFWVAISITLEVAKDSDFNPIVRETVTRLRQPVYAGWEQRLVASGWTAQAAARTVRSGASMMSGAAIRRFWAEPDDITDEVERQWLADQLAAL